MDVVILWMVEISLYFILFCGEVSKLIVGYFLCGREGFVLRSSGWFVGFVL